jgi:hypothetical protein
LCPRSRGGWKKSRGASATIRASIRAINAPIRNIELRYPAPGGARPAPPLRQIEVVRVGGGWRYAVVAVAAALAGAAAVWLIA